MPKTRPRAHAAERALSRDPQPFTGDLPRLRTEADARRAMARAKAKQRPRATFAGRRAW